MAFLTSDQSPAQAGFLFSSNDERPVLCHPENAPFQKHSLRQWDSFRNRSLHGSNWAAEKEPAAQKYTIVI